MSRENRPIVAGQPRTGLRPHPRPLGIECGAWVATPHARRAPWPLPDVALGGDVFGGKYRNIPGPLWDVVLTVAAAVLTTVATRRRINLAHSLILWFGLAVVVHWWFGVPTALNQMLLW